MFIFYYVNVMIDEQPNLTEKPHPHYEVEITTLFTVLNLCWLWCNSNKQDINIEWINFLKLYWPLHWGGDKMQGMCLSLESLEKLGGKKWRYWVIVTIPFSLSELGFLPWPRPFSSEFKCRSQSHSWCKLVVLTWIQVWKGSLGASCEKNWLEGTWSSFEVGHKLLKQDSTQCMYDSYDYYLFTLLYGHTSVGTMFSY